MSFTFSTEQPDYASWRSLEDHQSVTPTSFVGGPPVLHAHSTGCHVVLNRSYLDANKQFKQWFEPPSEPSNLDGNNDQDAHAAERIVKTQVDIWVTSEALILGSNIDREAALKTIKVSYPAISLHATQHIFTESSADSTQLNTYSNTSLPGTNRALSALYFQLDPLVDLRNNSNPDVDDIDGTLDLVIVPEPNGPVTNGLNGDAGLGADGSSLDGSSEQRPTSNKASVEQLYEALNNCADLWPDEEEQEEDEAALMPAIGGLEDLPTPGGGRWITAENVEQFQDVTVDAEEVVDADGHITILGPGAGIRRAREDNGDDDDRAHDPGTGDADETKWQRTS